MLSPLHGLQLVLGLTVWLVWFGLSYSLLTIGCVIDPQALEQGPFTWINALLLTLTLLTAALLFYGALRSGRAARTLMQTQAVQTQVDDAAARRMIGYLAAGVHFTGAVATLAVGLPITYLPPCL